MDKEDWLCIKLEMISKVDLIPIIIFCIMIKAMTKTMRTRNSKIFKSNFYIYAYNRPFLRETMF